MTRSNDNEVDESRRQEAHWFVARLKSGEATSDDAEALQRWRARDPANEKAFQEAVHIWKLLGPALGKTEEKPYRVSLSRRAFLAGTGMAASAAGVALTGSALGFLPTLDALAADYATGVGEQKTITLTDGTRVELDGQSALKVAMTSERRELSLMSGAAVFSVAPEERPFFVSAENGVSRTTASAFSMRYGVDHIDVACLEGRVDVLCGDVANLASDEAVSYSLAGLSAKDTADSEAVAAWRRGLLVFQDRPLEDVLTDLNRHRRGKVVLARGSLANRRVSGVFHLARTDEILVHIENALNLTATSLVGGIILLH